MSGVNKPFDEAQKQVNINQKLHLYGIGSAFEYGKLPSNDQIDVALNSFIASKALSNPSAKLSAEGKALLADVREVVQLAKILILTKNKGNLLQDFIWQTRQADLSNLNIPGAPISKDAAKEHGREAIDGLRTLGTLLLTNGQFRKLLKDVALLFREIASDAAVNAAGRLRPSDEQLGQIDRPAEDNTWHEAPNLSANNLKQQAQNVYHGNPVEDVKGAAKVAANASGHGNNQADSSVADIRAGVNSATDRLTQRVGDNIDDGTKKKVKDEAKLATDRLRGYLRQKVPKERREQTSWRLKRMVLECQQHPDYAQAIQTLLKLAEQYGQHGQDMAKEASGTAQHTRSGLSAAETDLKTLIERFANSTSTDPLWDSIDQLYTDANQDRELKNWFISISKYARRCLLEQGYVMEDESTQEWNKLYDHGRYLLREKYRAHTDQVLDEIKFLAEQFDHDPQNKSFGLAVQKLFENLGNDDNGKPTFKPHLVKDLRDVILPALFEGISYVPVPRIEYTDPTIDLIIENLVLESDNFMPNVIEFNSESHFKWGRKHEASNMSQTIEIKIKGIQMDLRNVAFYFKQKRGFPGVKDQGLADIYLPGDGFCAKIKLATSERSDSQSYFKAQKVDVDLHHLQIKVVKGKYKTLFTLVKPLILHVLKPAIEKAVEKTIKDKINQLDHIFADIKQEADRAKGDLVDNPDQLPNIYNRYVSASQKRFLQGKQKAQDAVADKQVNVAVTQEDSIFPDVALEGGISTKATEYRQQARAGKAWESPIFSIGSASKSSDIPPTQEIGRKSRPTPASASYQAANGQSNNHYGANAGNNNVQQPTYHGAEFGHDLDNKFATLMQQQHPGSAPTVGGGGQTIESAYSSPLQN